VKRSLKTKKRIAKMLLLHLLLAAKAATADLGVEAAVAVTLSRLGGKHVPSRLQTVRLVNLPELEGLRCFRRMIHSTSSVLTLKIL
jgi:hypothetical protein